VGTAAERLLIWGAGGHGKVVADLIRACGHELLGFVDSDGTKLGTVVEPGGGVVVATEEDFLARLGAGDDLPDDADAVVVAVGRNDLRSHQLAALQARLARALCHPAATVSPSAVVERGSVVFAGAVINADARVGTGCIVNSGAIVEHDSVLETAVHVSPGAVLSGSVRVEAEAWIGAGAVVIEGITVGARTTVGAGAVVVRDLPPDVIAVGVPARPLPPARLTEASGAPPS
jgi:sugar O-acyltransferase (sialic acid O-acetyltransferase NeuD family)